MTKSEIRRKVLEIFREFEGDDRSRLLVIIKEMLDDEIKTNIKVKE